MKNLIPATLLAGWLSILIALPSSGQELKDAIKSNPPELVTALVARSGGIFRRIYTYETESGRHFYLRQKLRGVKDVRPYEVQHPYWHKTQEGFRRWNPVVNGATDGALGYFAISGAKK